MSKMFDMFGKRRRQSRETLIWKNSQAEKLTLAALFERQQRAVRFEDAVSLNRGVGGFTEVRYGRARNIASREVLFTWVSHVCESCGHTIPSGSRVEKNTFIVDGSVIPWRHEYTHIAPPCADYAG